MVVLLSLNSDAQNENVEFAIAIALAELISKSSSAGAKLCSKLTSTTLYPWDASSFDTRAERYLSSLNRYTPFDLANLFTSLFRVRESK